MANLYPAAIDSDEEVEADESGEDENMEDIEAVAVKKKKKVAGAADEFSPNFSFECSDEQRLDRDDAALKKYLRKEVASTLEEKIEAVRKAKNTSKEVEVVVKDEDDGVEQLGGKEARDTLREKKKMGKKNVKKQDDFFEEAMDVSDNITFDQMNLSRPMLKAIAAAGYTEPTPIQAACIPVALSGKDICACAATGTGKTAAFVLPILERLLYRSNTRSCTRILVLVPTRELAIQVFQVFRKLSTYSQVEVCLCAGGLDLKTQEAALRTGPDVVVATPGRLIDHLHNSPSFSLNNVEVLVLDEADRMLEEAFKDQMNELIRLCAPNRQTLLFSATMTDQIDELASMSLKKPVKIFINENTETALKLRQEFIRIRAGRETDREAIVSALVTRTFQENTIIFVRMKKDCQRLHILLGLLGLKAGQMHSSLSQAMRIEALSKFKRREIDVLISTDLASRGLDIEGVQTVINMHMPKTIKQYIHRVGRTARAGRAGRSISLVGEDDRKLLKEIINTNPDRTLKQRMVAPEVVEAYRQRIDSLEESIREIDLEEKEEKELRLAESALTKTKEKLETGTTEREGRVWFQKPTVSERERRRAETRAQRKEEMKRKQAAKTPEEIRMEHEMAYQAREAKRARRGKNRRLRAVVETPFKRKHNPVSKKKTMRLSDIPAVESSSTPSATKKKKTVTGKKSSFTSALTAIGKRAVKKARHGPEDSQFQKARVAHRLKTKKK
uniref:RNA helicase n=1 Tax=Haemonchus contortus TaxID=6289 RepID=A0A7I4XRS6_HAECO